MNGWDSAVALAYAAEELFLTAQALTTDRISSQHALSEAHRHLRGLLQHEGALPAEIGKRLRNLDATYAERENGGATDPAAADALSAETMAVLGDVRNLLTDRSSDHK